MDSTIEGRTLRRNVVPPLRNEKRRFVLYARERPLLKVTFERTAH
jgi:hypothetical protein